MIYLYAIVLYFMIVWILTRLIVPHLGFSKETVPNNIPDSLKDKINELSDLSYSNKQFLELAYNYVTNKYTGSRVKTITHFWRAFGNVFSKSDGFLPCTGQNYLLRTMLIKSNRFVDGDIRAKIVPLNFFIHQYLQIKIDGIWIDVDPWSQFLNIPLGKKSSILG